MPRILSTALLVEKNKLASDHVFTWLFEVDIVGAPGPFRLAAYDQDVTFHGLLFTRSVIDVDAIEQPTHASLVNLSVSVQNVDQQVMSLLENYWATQASPSWTVTIWQTDMTQVNETPFTSGEVYTVQQATTDLVNCTFELVAEGVNLVSIIPKRRYTASQGFLAVPRRT